jgi:hypothetical protein
LKSDTASTLPPGTSSRQIAAEFATEPTALLPYYDLLLRRISHRASFHVLPKAFTAARQARHNRADWNTEDLRRFSIGEIVYPDQKQYRSLIFRQFGKSPQEIAICEHSMLSTADVQIFLNHFGKHTIMPALSILLSDKTIVQDCIQPTAEISIRPALVPARQRSFETVLHEIVSAITVATQQGTREFT